MDRERPHDRNARFQGRRIYLTGAASGIGLATARLLAEGGAALALVDLDHAGLERAAAETGGRPFVADLRDGAAIDGSVAAAAAALGGLDGVINCAGVGHGARLETLEPAEWERVLAVNLSAPYRVCRAALPWLQGQADASIVNVASGMALLPTGPGVSAYAASKGGLISFTKALAAELAPQIRANVVCPGLASTPMTAGLLQGHSSGDPPPPFLAQYALKRAADATEVAQAIAFLSSREASYITGVVLAADGGRTFH
ncbi:SDR family NAD(P)-dependent oxidoreductase [Phenylobacterium sp. LjRoot219]|uniref:SDR family NAD(P)-dependent oxidoreductase n=1 Tax=Phenylobacterium sp. LjRoot219 TaxID=3342283 RepID=UPI003ECDEA86